MGDATSQGGHVVKNIGPIAGVTLDTTVDIPVTPPTWLIATVRGPIDPVTHDSHALWPVVQSPVPPFAITNPIWIDANADNIWTPLRN